MSFADRDDRQPEVADLLQQPVQRRLVGDRTGNDALARPVAVDVHALEPRRPGGVEGPTYSYRVIARCHPRSPSVADAGDGRRGRGSNHPAEVASAVGT